MATPGLKSPALNNGDHCAARIAMTNAADANAGSRCQESLVAPKTRSHTEIATKAAEACDSVRIVSGVDRTNAVPGYSTDQSQSYSRPGPLISYGLSPCNIFVAPNHT